MIKAIIIDDEVHCLDTLSILLKEYCPDVQVTDECRSAKQGLEAIEKIKPDLVFLDIEMPMMNGFQLLEKIGDINFSLVFVTAYDQFAVKAFRFSALDYLLKPVNAEELRQAINRFLEKRNLQLHTDALLKNLLRNLEIKKETDFKLAIPTISGALFFSPSEIVRLEGEGNYSRFFLTNDRKYVSAKTMKEYQEILVQHNFLRIHKSHLVNKSFIDSYQHEGSVLLKDKSILPVSRQRKQEVAAALKG